MFRRLICLAFFVVLVLGLNSDAIAQPTGKILIEYWNGITGTVLDDFYNHARWPDDPDDDDFLTLFDRPYDPVYGDNYGARLRGYLYPPSTGDYSFWVAGDDDCDLWLSTDDDPANKVLIAWIDGWCPAYDFDNTGGTDNPDQDSAPISLQAGKKYYIEATYKEGGGGDGIAVAWQGPGIQPRDVIQGDYLSPFIRPVDLMASEPTPADGGMNADTWVTLAWQPGLTAVSHDVYFSDVLADVEAGTGEAARGNQAADSYIVGFPGYPYPEGLVPGTTYYWRIDEIEADGTLHAGQVWSFMVPPLKAYNPGPLDGTRFVATDATLSWEAGFGAKLHYVYFDDDPDVVANATGGALAAVTTYNPGELELNKTYYWRVDEFDPPFTHKGDVWSFTTTLSGLGTAVMDRWENIPDTDINLLKDNFKYPNNPDVTETVDEFLWDGEDLSDYGARIEAWVYAPATGDYTFWLAADDQGELWLSPDDDSSNVEMIAYVKDSPTATGGWTDLNEWTKYPSQKSDPISLIAGEKYYIMAIWKEAGGGDHCHVAWEGPGISTRTTIPGGNLSPYEPVNALGAKPANLATGVTQTPILKWKPGALAESHEVYFGTDEATVASATKSSPEYKGARTLGKESFDPGKLAWETTYYWRVDEVAAGNPDSPWLGKVWSFTTADFLIVDDFEGYTDDDAANEAVWQAWIDGYGVNTNGSQSGYLQPPYCERTIVYGGRQSLPLHYNNTGGVTNSEAELKITAPRDWTEGGVETLSIWFQGQPASTGIASNAAEPLYVAVSNATGAPVVVTHDDPAAAQIDTWTEWTIDLSEFSSQGINLRNVDKIAIGLGSKGGAAAGGSGLVYIDNITLR